MKKILTAAVFLCASMILCQPSFAKKTAKPQPQPVVKDAAYYVKLGAEYEWLNNRAGAVDIYTKALQIDPNCNEARNSRLKLNYFLGRYNQVLEDCEYFYNLPGYGAAAYYEYRINSKKQLGDYAGAVDDMYEVILAYGGQAKVLEDLFNTVSNNPELEYKLRPQSHPELLSKYKNQAKLLRDYAQMYKDSHGKVINQQYYDFFTGLAKALDPAILINVEYIKPEIRSVSEDAENIIINE